MESIFLNYSIKVFVNTDKSKVDTYGKSPVRFYVNIAGERITRSMGIKVKPKDWNQQGQQVRKSDPIHSRHNHTIQKTLSNVREKIQDAFNSGREVTPVLVQEILHGKSTNDDFWKYKEIFIDELIAKGYAEGTVANYQAFYKDLLKFSPQLRFKDITEYWLSKYESHLRTGGYAHNTIRKHFTHLASVFNSAKRNKVTSNYPFPNYKRPKYIQSIRVFLTPEEIERVEEVLLKNLPEELIRTAYYFLLGCYSSLRFSDWSRFKQHYDKFVQGNRFVLWTKKNKEIIGIEMHDKLKRIVEKIKELPPPLSYGDTSEWLMVLANAAGINKHITTHVARHSYCTRCLLLRIPDHIICHTMGITQDTLEVYKHLVHSDADEEMKKWNEL